MSHHHPGYLRHTWDLASKLTLSTGDGLRAEDDEVLLVRMDRRFTGTISEWATQGIKTPRSPPSATPLKPTAPGHSLMYGPNIVGSNPTDTGSTKASQPGARSRKCLAPAPETPPPVLLQSFGTLLLAGPARLDTLDAAELS
ncbi:hypothetical protein C8Q79DRAFT_1007721 [Trametes meyenii]|nr:hypothetical protein C8Q79DRAFT_1007721 [Trametes meyenii]